MRKYLFSGAVIGSAFGLIGLVRSTARGPRDTRLALNWAGWAIGMAIAVGSLREKSRQIGEKQRE